MNSYESYSRKFLNSHLEENMHSIRNINKFKRWNIEKKATTNILHSFNKKKKNFSYTIIERITIPEKITFSRLYIFMDTQHVR